MSTVQIQPAINIIPAPTEPPPPQLTLQDELMTLARETARDCGVIVSRAAGKRPMPETLWVTLSLVYAPRKSQLERALLVSEKPSVTRYFTEALKWKKLHEEKAKKLATLAAKLKCPAPIAKADAAFQDYWKKISVGNELEFVGALWILESVLQPGHLLEEISTATACSPDGETEENQISYLSDLAEFATFAVSAYCRHPPEQLLFESLFGAWETPYLRAQVTNPMTAPRWARTIPTDQGRQDGDRGAAAIKHGPAPQC